VHVVLHPSARDEKFPTNAQEQTLNWFLSPKDTCMPKRVSLPNVFLSAHTETHTGRERWRCAQGHIGVGERGRGGERERGRGRERGGRHGVSYGRDMHAHTFPCTHRYPAMISLHGSHDISSTTLAPNPGLHVTALAASSCVFLCALLCVVLGAYLCALECPVSCYRIQHHDRACVCGLERKGMRVHGGLRRAHTSELDQVTE